MIPLSDPGAENAPLLQELDAATQRVLRSGQYILGAEVEAFEAEVAEYLGAPQAVSCSSASDALWLSLLACDVSAGDEVITSGYSFFAAVEAVLRVGARPVLVDIAGDGFLADPAQILARLSERTRAVIWVHLFGEASDLSSLRVQLAQRGVSLIEDAAQAFGASSAEGKLGAQASVSCFSFFPTKNLGAVGDGGLITCQSRPLAERLRRLRAHGAQRRYMHDELGGNCRLDAMQAAILRVKLPHLDELLARRREHARAYARALGPLEQLWLPDLAPTHSFNQYVLRLRADGVSMQELAARRDALAQALQAQGVATQVYYPIHLGEQPLLRQLGLSTELPRAKLACAASLALPMYAALSEEQRSHVAQSVQIALQNVELSAR